MGEEHEMWKAWLEDFSNETDLGNITVTGSNDDTWIDFDQWYKKEQDNTITLKGGGEEMLRVAPDGFYVRGVRVEADAKEAKHVYEAFKQWLTWNTLSSN
jgi:predicted PolB exonuclease-like 3'-5' exonuclease